MSWEYTDDPTAIELFELAARALVDPGDPTFRREFWKHIDENSAHPWVQVLTRAGAASHPLGLSEGNKLIVERIEDASEATRPMAGAPDWMRGAFRAFGVG